MMECFSRNAKSLILIRIIHEILNLLRYLVSIRWVDKNSIYTIRKYLRCAYTFTNKYRQSTTHCLKDS